MPQNNKEFQEYMETYDCGAITPKVRDFMWDCWQWATKIAQENEKYNIAFSVYSEYLTLTPVESNTGFAEWLATLKQ